MIITSVFLITPNSANATCSISDADPAVVTVDDNNCSVQPALYGIKTVSYTHLTLPTILLV